MKIHLSSQWEQLRSAASRYFPASTPEPEDRTIELGRPLFDECKEIADQLGTTVQSVIYEALAHYIARHQSIRIPEGNLTAHPLQLLDGLTGRTLEETGGDRA